MPQLTIQQTFNLALQRHKSGRLQEAQELYRQLLAQDPNHPGSLHYLGVLAIQSGQPQTAVDLIRRAISVRPNYSEAHSNLGIALKDLGQLDAAVASFRQAISLKPNYPEAHNNLGNALKTQDDIDQSIAAFRKAISLRPNYAEAHSNLGNAFKAKGEFSEAIASYRRAIAISPSYPEARSNLALALLLLGDFNQGLPEYEWRWKLQGLPSPDRGFSQPFWDGSPLMGRTILLHAEQGFGDTIQFIRYLSKVAARGGGGGRVLVRVQKELVRLLKQLPFSAQWLTFEDPLPAFDVHCPIPSLPRVFATTRETIPAQTPALLPDPDLAQSWQRRLAAQSSNAKVGLTWAGSPTHTNDRHRSIPPTLLAPLMTVPGLTFVSLQKSHPARPPVELPSSSIDWTEEFFDFADTAALIANLDLVISVDTSVAHLAAAMGKPVWLLLPEIPDWRWLLNRKNSPWYPTMRLFRKPSRGDWASVIAQVAGELSEWLKNRP